MQVRKRVVFEEDLREDLLASIAIQQGTRLNAVYNRSQSLFSTLRATALMASGGALDARALFWTRPNSAIRRPTDRPDQSFGRLPALKLSRFSSWVTQAAGSWPNLRDTNPEVPMPIGARAGPDCSAEGIALTTDSRRACDQDRFAKCLINAYFLSVDDIRR
jgi:hypothetical protein